MFAPTGDPTRPQLRVFAGLSLIIGSVLVFLAWREGPLVWNRPSSLWFSTVLLPTGLVGTIAPTLVRGVYKAAMTITRPIGFVVAQVMLAVLYYLILFPLALLLRITGYDPLHKKPPARWVAVPEQTKSKRRYFRQY